MNVTIVRRWGNHQPGTTLDLDTTTAAWLIAINYAGYPGRATATTVTGGPAAPRPVDLRSPRRANQALPVDGAPLTYGSPRRPSTAA